MNLDWIAGFFDGEGSVSLQFHHMPSCKYGYQFLPCIVITQKNHSILKEIQAFLGIGRIYQHGTGTWSLEIRRQSGIRKFILNFLPLSNLKKRQLILLQEAIGLLYDGPLRGQELWGGALPRGNVLRLLDIVAEMRSLNGIRGKRTNDINQIRKLVANFDEDAYQKRIRESWRKRIAPLIRGRLRPLEELHQEASVDRHPNSV